MNNKNPGRFAGWWGNDVWYLDSDNGTDTASGEQGKNNIGRPQSVLTNTLAECGPGDTIYVRPRTTVGTQGTNATKVIADVNWTIARANAHLSIIGTGPNGGLGQVLPAVIFQSVGSGTAPTFLVNAPFFTMENCAIFAIASQTAGTIKVTNQAPGTDDGYAAMIDNCSFHNWSNTGYAALCFDSGRYNVVKNSQFWHCRQGVFIFGGGRTIHGAAIRNCDFHGRDTDIDADITVSAADHLTIDGNMFNHETPAKAAGVYLKYVDCYGTAYGTLSDNTFGTVDTAMSTICDLSNMVDVGNKCSANAGWLTV